MNRVIKFRIWDNGRKEWVHGPGHEVNLFGEIIICGELLRRDYDDTHVSLDDINDMVALQFCGLHDKKDTEIYDGDVLQYSLGNEWVMKYRDTRFHAVRICDGATTYHKAFLKKCEIIGNIYSNPELPKA